jgi:hypothetical protein
MKEVDKQRAAFENSHKLIHIVDNAKKIHSFLEHH